MLQRQLVLHCLDQLSRKARAFFLLFVPSTLLFFFLAQFCSEVNSPFFFFFNVNTCPFQIGAYI